MLGAASIRESWGELIAKLNESLHDYAHGSRMGTTLSGVIAMEGRYVVVHVGDTRIYRLSNDGIISQITEDQTRTNKLVAEGDITLEEAELSRDGHVIMQAIGSTKSIVPAFYSGRYRNGDLFVACSDGAWHCVGEEGIQSCFEEANWQSDESLDDACNRLINYDMSSGETDNLTVVCFAINETAPETSFEEFPKLGIMADAESSLGRADLTYVDITAVGVDSCEEGDA
jgi:serine/threonine protein phosphatase PrpC